MMNDAKTQLNRRIPVSVARLEERELDLKKEYNSLHQRHTEVNGSKKAPAGRKEQREEVLHSSTALNDSLPVLFVDVCR